MQLCQMQKRTLRSLIINRSCRAPRYHHHVQTTIEPILIEAVALSYQSNDPVPDNTVSYFFTYGNSQTVNSAVIIEDIHYKILIGKRLSFAIYPPEILISF